MNFATFQEQRPSLLAGRPGLLDGAETNLYRALADLLPPSPEPATGTVHRCHLASQWTELYGLPAAWSRRALISTGVRDSLARLFTHYADQRARLWLPEDNYPVYQQLATAAGNGLTIHTFPTLPEIQWPSAPPALGDELLLITHPLKPRNRPLDKADARHLLAWLQQSPRRRLLLDAVYTFETWLDEVTHSLLATGQTLLLHSLTKGWLHPRLFGIALVPEDDADALTPAFRENPPSQSSLNTARHLMTSHPDMPAAVARRLKAARQRLLAAMPAQISQKITAEGSGYLFPVPMPWQELLAGGILGLPASTFGSAREDITLISSLTFCHDTH